MSVTTRTNLVLNGSFETGVTGWTGTNCTPSQSSAQAFTGTKSMALTATTAAAFSVATATGTAGMAVSPSTAYTFQVQGRAAATARTVTLSITWYTAAGATISTSSGTGVGDVTTGFTQATVTATSPGTAAFASLSIGYNTAAASEVHYVDAVFGEAASSVGSYFDGSFVSAAGVVYAWTGTAYASTSTAKTYQPYLTLAQGTTPSSNVVVTFQDLDPATDVVNIWRTVDGKRRPVRGGRRRSVVGSDFLTDYEPAVGVTVSYDMEILSGVCAGVVVSTVTTTFSNPANGWLSDPLVPATAVAVYGNVGPNGEPGLDFEAFNQYEYPAAMSVLPVMGTDEPVGLVGQRQAATFDVAFSTMTTTQTAAVRALIKQAGVLLLRPVPGWSNALPDLCYVASKSIREIPQTERFGGSWVSWKATVSILTPPAGPVVVPTTTYGTVASNYSTYAAFNAAHNGQTYLAMIMNP